LRLDHRLGEATRHLAQALGIPVPEARREARLLAMHALGHNLAWLIAHGNEDISPAQGEALDHLIQRRMTGEPVAYILGEREFYSRSFRVSPATLIPRPETEHLVDAALGRFPADTPIRVLDIGTGSGCIAITLKCERPTWQVTALDIRPDTLEVAAANAKHHGVQVDFRQSDLFSALADARFDLIVSNPPYVAESDAHLERGDLRFEPRTALASGPDGLDCIRRLVEQAPTHLNPGGWLILEHGYDQGEAVPAQLVAAGYSEVFMARDLAGQPRFSAGRLG
jgi:release factor glutamine methyltransferase